MEAVELVARLYDTYPFPPDPVLETPPPGYNWRWSWPGAYGFCTRGIYPKKNKIRILDAGCGSGVSTEYLAHLNPEAEIWAIDISAGTLAVAQERINKTVPSTRQIHLQQLSIFDLDQIEGKFDFINSVGVLHHTSDPAKALQCLASKLNEGGLLHIFVYAEIGRWEIRLMQAAIALLRKGAGIAAGDFQQGVALGRAIFKALPKENRLVIREQSRWAMDNQRDECFADMYLHPLEVNFNIDSLFAMIDQSDLQFVGFSNPEVWQLERLLGSDPQLMHYTQKLSAQEQYRLIELLDTDIAHYEFFLTKPPLPQLSPSSEVLLDSVPVRHPCIQGWESRSLFDLNYRVVELSELEFAFMRQCNDNLCVKEILAQNPAFELKLITQLLDKHMILLQVRE
ncbi:MAG: class I SAM-dependent methyltransferase [Pseudanabaenaceae cyanobacterium]